MPDRRRYEPAQGLIVLVVAALVGWGLYHAVGAYRLNHDLRRSLVVIGSMALFLGLWLVLLASRRRRLERRHPSEE